MSITRSEMVEALVDREMDNIFEAGVEEFVRNVLIHGSSRVPFSKMTDVEVCEAWDETFGEED